MGGPVDIPGDQLRTIVERIEHIEKEISELNEGKKEIFKRRRATASILKSFEKSSACENRIRRSARSTSPCSTSI